MKTIFQILIICVISFSSNAQKEEKTFFDSGELETVSVLSKDGLINNVLYYYRNGNLKAKGEWRGYYSLSGNIRWEKMGDWNFYYENGELAQSGGFYDSEKHGEWKYYNEQEKMIRKEEYNLSGELSGNVIDYYENGQIARESYFLGGKIDGEDKIYFDNGQISHISIWDKNKLMNIAEKYDREGNALDPGDLKDGNGFVNNYNKEGALESKTEIKNGVVEQ